jgi:hypothetical protein
MQPPVLHPPGAIPEVVRGIVDRVTYHNPDNGWSVLRVIPFDAPHQQERSEERRVGKECRRLCRSRWSPYH